MDAYLHRIQASLPPETIHLLEVLAFLPVSGCRLDLLADFLNVTGNQVESMVGQGQDIGALIFVGGRARFSHDRQRVSCSLYPAHLGCGV